MRGKGFVVAAVIGLALSTEVRAEDAPRGLATLGMLHESWKGNKKDGPGTHGLESVTDILRACPNPEVAFLYTTFGLSYANAAEVVKPLIAEGRKPRVAIYLLNGPGRRSPTRRPHIDFYPNLEPGPFRDKVGRNDAKVVADFKAKILAPTRAFVDAMNAYAASVGKPAPRFIIIPELEDNFGSGAAGKQAFGNLLGLARAAFQGVANVEYRRNPLPDNDKAPTFDALRVPNLPLEIHTNQVSVLDKKMKKGDTITGDGAHFLYSSETGSDGPPIPIQEQQVTFAGMKTLLEHAEKKGVGVLLWRAEWQGLRENAPGNPDTRLYNFPWIGTPQHEDLRELLHHGEKTKLPPSNPKVPTKFTATTVKPNGTKFDGNEGFLWKPVSDSNGKLVILTPKTITGRILRVNVTDAAGKVLDRSSYHGVGNGDREHWRFGKSGSGYPANSRAQVLMGDGTSREYLIPAPSQRFD